MIWYIVFDQDGMEVKRVLASTLADLAANVPPNHTVTPVPLEAA